MPLCVWRESRETKSENWRPTLFLCLNFNFVTCNLGKNAFIAVRPSYSSYIGLNSNLLLELKAVIHINLIMVYQLCVVVVSLLPLLLLPLLLCLYMFIQLFLQDISTSTIPQTQLYAHVSALPHSTTNKLRSSPL